MYHCFRLHRGDDLYESIQRYADAHHIAAGVVLSAVGCVYRWELRDASGVDVQSGTEDVEIVSLMGTVSEHGSHLHASLARRDLSVFGGHLRPGCLVNTTAEIVLREHQRNAIAHTLYGGNTLLAHVVGAGKSVTRS